MARLTKTIALSLTPEVYEKICQEAEAVNRRPPAYLRQMIRLYYKHLEQHPDSASSLKVE